MRQINLRSDGAGQVRTRSVSLSLVIGLLFLIIAGGVLGGIFLYKVQLQKSIAFAEAEMKKKEQGIDRHKFQEVYDLQGRIMDVKKYSAESNSQVEVLNVISAKTFENTLYENISIERVSSSSSLVEATIIVGDADQLSSQLNAYKQSPQIENIKLGNSTLEEQGLRASFAFNVKDDAVLENQNNLK